MRRRICVGVSLIVLLFGVNMAAQAASTTDTTAQRFSVKKLILKKKKSFIKAKGSRPVVIKDKARVTKNLHVKGNITLGEGSTVDGVNVSSLSAAYDALENTVSNLQLSDIFPDGCSSGEVLTFTGSTWQCGTDQNTTYTAGDGLSLSGTELSLTGYDNLIVVAKSGGDYTTIGEATTAITDAGDAAYDNHYTIYVAPGWYSENVTLPDYTHLVGAARDAVTIAAESADATTGVVNVNYQTSLSNVTLQSLDSTTAVGMYIESAPAKIHNVQINVDYNSTTAYGVNSADESLTVEMVNVDINVDNATSTAYGIYASVPFNLENVDVELDNTEGANLTSYGIVYDSEDSLSQYIRDSDILVSYADTCTVLELGSTSYGVYIDDSSLETLNCTANVGINMTDAYLIIRDSTIEAQPDDAILMAAGFMRIANTYVAGTVTQSSGTFQCVYAYDDAFEELNADCQTP